jgi:arginine decarboxylase
VKELIYRSLQRLEININIAPPISKITLMKHYEDLVSQTFDFPTEEFQVVNSALRFHEIPLMEIIKTHGTPLKLSYLPKIGQNIKKARRLFKDAMKKHHYSGDYLYCYCTKSSHFRFVVEEALKNGAHLETSSAYDLEIVKSLEKKGSIDKQSFIICNGFKRPLYLRNIAEVINDGFINCIPVLDNLSEIEYYSNHIHIPWKAGIRVAADEEPNFEFYTSRLGIRYSDVNEVFEKSIKNNPNVELKMLHFFIHPGITDSAYFWSELSRFIFKYCELKKKCPTLDMIDIGGGFPIKTSLQFDFDYAYIIDQIVQNIKWICDKNHVPTPNIVTEFGAYTVGESGATIYSVLDQKLQNDKELWYMIDGSFITHIPDSYAINQKYIMLAINHWREPYQKVNIGGLTCDSLDYYNSEAHSSEVFLPKIGKGAPLYIGFFHTGAYQESIGGYGGLQHCLIPQPKHILINRTGNGAELHTSVYAEEQSSQSMLDILGY